MTSQEIIDAARNAYSAVADTFFTDAELFDLLYKYCNELATENDIIESTSSTTTTVSGTRTYAFPTRLIKPVRVFWNGTPLMKTDFRGDDQITGSDEDTTSTGSTTHYFFWDKTFYLRPIPNAAYTLKVFGFYEHIRVTASTSISIPSEFHMLLVDPIVSNMHGKDSNGSLARYYMDMWANPMTGSKKKIREYLRKRKRGDSNPRVKLEEETATTILGAV